MATVSVTADALRRLLLQNQFPPATDRLMLFGFRGLAPASETAVWRKAPEAELAGVDHLHLRCTIAVWDTETDDVFLTLGSTVPHRSQIEKARRRGGLGANMNLTGRFSLEKGPHPWSGKSSHRALRQVGGRVQRRSSDDLDYDGHDRVEKGYTANNLHSAWCQGPGHPHFESAGCTVLQGYPSCRQRRGAPATGDWAAFDGVLYAGRGKAQRVVPYVLLHGHDVVRAARGHRLTPRVRFGSRGTLAKTVQQALIDQGYLAPAADGKFGQNSTLGLVFAQEDLFAPDADDGICGPGTAAALGVDWPGDLEGLAEPDDLERVEIKPADLLDLD